MGISQSKSTLHRRGRQQTDSGANDKNNKGSNQQNPQSRSRTVILDPKPPAFLQIPQQTLKNCNFEVIEEQAKYQKQNLKGSGSIQKNLTVRNALNDKEKAHSSQSLATNDKSRTTAYTRINIEPSDSYRGLGQGQVNSSALQVLDTARNQNMQELSILQGYGQQSAEVLDDSILQCTLVKDIEAMQQQMSREQKLSLQQPHLKNMRPELPQSASVITNLQVTQEGANKKVSADIQLRKSIDANQESNGSGLNNQNSQLASGSNYNQMINTKTQPISASHHLSLQTKNHSSNLTSKSQNTKMGSAASTSLSQGSSSSNHSPSLQTNPRDVAMMRYHAKFVKKMPECDQTDFILQPMTKAEQAVPDYAQEVYNHLRQQEKAQLAASACYKLIGSNATSSKIDQSDRDKCARRVMELCKEKGYRLETFMIAVNVLDRFLAVAGPKLLTTEQAKQSQLPVIITTVTIMAAKLEQPMTPSINRMIKLLTDYELQFVDKAKVITMEGTIIKYFNCDFLFLSPLPFLERFLRQIDHSVETERQSYSLDSMDLSSGNNTKPSQLLFPIAVDILKFVHSKAELLWGNLPSLLAAAILCIAQKIVRASCLPTDMSPMSARWLAFPLWDSKMQEQTGIKNEDFEELTIMIELSYRQLGGGSTSYLLFPST